MKREELEDYRDHALADAVGPRGNHAFHKAARSHGLRDLGQILAEEGQIGATDVARGVYLAEEPFEHQGAQILQDAGQSLEAHFRLTLVELHDCLKALGYLAPGLKEVRELSQRLNFVINEVLQLVQREMPLKVEGLLEGVLNCSD